MPGSGAFTLFPELKGEQDRKEQFSDAFARLVWRPCMLSWNQVLEIQFYGF